MTKKKTIDAERDYVDEKVGCGVNGMTFEERLSYQNQMLRYFNTYSKKNTIHRKMNHQTKTNHLKKKMNRMTIITTVFVCAIQPILEQAIAVVTPETRIAMVNVT